MPNYEQDGKQRNLEQRTLGSKRTYRQPKLKGFTSDDQKALKETFPCILKNPLAEWHIGGEPGVSISTYFERNQEGLYDLQIEFKVDDEVREEGQWIMDTVTDLVTDLNATDVLIGDRWIVRGIQAYWLGDNSTMFVQANGDETYTFITYSNSMFKSNHKAKAEDTFELQMATIQNDQG